MGDRLHAPADDINYATIAVGDVVDYVFSHRSPGYDTFYVCIRRPAQHTFEVRLERRVPPHRKRGGPAPNACVTYVSQAVCQSADEVHQHLREEVPYSSYEATKCGPPTQQQGINPPAVELPTALLRFSRSRGEWVEVAAATQPRLYKDAASKWHLEVAGAQEPNNVPVDFKTFVFEEGALRLTFSAANNTWALRFGSKAAHNAFHEQMFPQWTDTA